jgi:hypothetical protein
MSFVKSTTATDKVCLTNGLTLIAGGTGIADITIKAPSPGHKATIRIISISSGDVVVSTPAGVTFDGTNNTATFNAVEDSLELVYNSSTSWAIKRNTSVVLSVV